MTVKTDRKDARGIAQLLRMGCYRSEHAKSVISQEATHFRNVSPVQPIFDAIEPIAAHCDV